MPRQRQPHRHTDTRTPRCSLLCTTTHTGMLPCSPQLQLQLCIHHRISVQRLLPGPRLGPSSGVPQGPHIQHSAQYVGYCDHKQVCHRGSPPPALQQAHSRPFDVCWTSKLVICTHCFPRALGIPGALLWCPYGSLTPWLLGAVTRGLCATP